MRERGPDDSGGVACSSSKRWRLGGGVHEGTTHVWFELPVDKRAAILDLAEVSFMDSTGGGDARRNGIA